MAGGGANGDGDRRRPEAAGESAAAPPSGAGGGGEGGANGEGAAEPIEVDWLYRVYAVKKDMPSLERLLARLTGGNPYNPEGGFVFPPGGGMRRLQAALGADPNFFVMGYHREEAPALWEELAQAYPEQAERFDDDDHLIVRNARLCVVIRATIANPSDNSYVETLCHLADAFRDLQRGVVWDVRMGRLWGGEPWAQLMQAPMSPLSHVRIVRLGEGEERILRTQGLQKFGNPDLEVKGGPAHLEREIEGLLYDASYHIMRGDVLGPDETITYEQARLRTVALARPEGAHPVLRFVDDPGPEIDVVDPEAGMREGFRALQRAREKVEGKRWEWQW